MVRRGTVLLCTLGGSQETKPLMMSDWKSDSLIVVKKRPEQAELALCAEGVERRGLTERKRFQRSLAMTQSMGKFNLQFGKVRESSEAGTVLFTAFHL